MPEGDTIWRAATRLHEVLADQVITDSDFRVPAFATADVSGYTVIQVASRGKHILMRLARQDAEPLTIHSHFRMDGSWHIYRTGETYRGGPAHSIRAILRTSTHDIVGYRLGVLELLTTADEPSVIGHLGVDVMSDHWSLDAAVSAVHAHPEMSIGDALLDQRLICGIGNLYRCESLFIRKVTPWTPVAEVNVRPLIDTAATLIRRNRWEPRQITTGDSRRGWEHFVHARGGRPCRKCGTAVSVHATGQEPQARLAYWCRVCQQGAPPPA